MQFRDDSSYFQRLLKIAELHPDKDRIFKAQLLLLNYSSNLDLYFSLKNSPNWQLIKEEFFSSVLNLTNSAVLAICLLENQFEKLTTFYALNGKNVWLLLQTMQQYEQFSSNKKFIDVLIN